MNSKPSAWTMLWRTLKTIPWSSLAIHDKKDSFFLKWSPYLIVLYWASLSISWGLTGHPIYAAGFGVGSAVLYAVYLYLLRSRRRSRVAHEQFMQYLEGLAEQQKIESAKAPRVPIELQSFFEGWCSRCREPITQQRPAVQCYTRKHLTHVECLEVIVDHGVQCPSCSDQAAQLLQLTIH